MAHTKKRSLRGFSIVEAMVASGVLIIGLTGITIMLTRGAVNGRNGQQMAVSADYTAQVMSELEATGFESLIPTPGVSFDAGTAPLYPQTFTDGSGRTYTAHYMVTDLGYGTNPAYQLDVEVSYVNGVGQTIYRHATSILSKAPDAG